jgi:hypothetical protein
MQGLETVYLVDASAGTVQASRGGTPWGVNITDTSILFQVGSGSSVAVTIIRLTGRFLGPIASGECHVVTSRRF